MALGMSENECTWWYFSIVFRIRQKCSGEYDRQDDQRLLQQISTTGINYLEIGVWRNKANAEDKR